MPECRDDQCFQPADEFPGIRAFLRDQTVAPESFNSLIGRHDEMFLYTLEATKGDRHLSSLDYFAAGRRMVDMIRQLVDWYFGGFGEVSRFLDFASGYGRGIRYLIQELAAERVWASDIYEHAIEFQRQRHGVHGVVSVSDPDAFPPPGLASAPGFECITAVSFFSHVPRATFARWMTKLYGLLAPGGMLAFSVHDITMTAARKGPDADFVFFSNSESGSLDGHEYGTTYVSERAVRAIIAATLPSHVVVRRIPKGVSHYQDLYVVADDPARGSRPLEYRHHPQGDMHPCTIGPSGNLELSGWAADPNQGGRIEDIQVLVNGQLVQRCMPYAVRPDVAAKIGAFARLSGWWCQVGSEQITPVDTVLVKAVNTGRLETVLAADTMQRLVTT
jgi:SAM-dependent methyltransferase